MKSIIIIALCFAAALAAPPQDSKDAVVVRSDYDNGIDSYSYAVETSDGKAVYEEGALKNVGTEDEALVVRGQYSFTGPDGIVYQITYIADENGYQPQGAHIPKN